MGYDIHGLSPNEDPKDENGQPIGEYFRNNIWWWRSLWSLVGGHGETLLRRQAGEEAVDMPDELLSEMNPGVWKQIDEWREKWYKGCTNDGEEYTGFWWEHLCETCEDLIANQDEDIVVNFLNDIQEEYGEDYPFSWENMENFHEFVANSGGIQIC
tara:strand:- start:4344 stop:4811 length:468 start_codon:yes stop_codon:yes gene_type:complete